MDKNLETGLLIGAGLGLAMAPVIKKVAKALPGIEQIEKKVLSHMGHEQGKEHETEPTEPTEPTESTELSELTESDVKFIPIINATNDEEV